ncbi:MAG: IS110 family transposase [gamma proteobacterium endosymbiont of Lamellibrachia anaximandri]|nr:IS110 family transposase [gamma proteobacterium endosymbiont of Lamellibrachia anaximandri]
MKFYTKSHSHFCGIDLHARCLYVCILDASGEPCLHKKISASPQALMKVISPYRDDLVIGVECMFSWYWVADFCEDNNIHFILGHALYMRAIHGGKAKNDKIDSLKIALLMRGGMFPLAYVYPRQLRGTRDLLRRRIHMMRKRSELLAHVHNTTSQYNLPAIGKNLRYSFNREGIAEIFSDPSVRKSIEFDLALIDFYDKQLSKVEWHIKQKVTAFDQHALLLLRSVPGIGLILSLVILCEIHDIDRFSRVQNFSSYARLVKCKHESAGKTYGTGGSKIGNAYLKWAFSEAAVLFLRKNPEAQAWLEKKSNQHNKAKALTILAHKLGRAVFFMLKRKVTFNQEQFLTG